MSKNTNETDIDNKLKFIGLNLKRIPSLLKDFEPLNFVPSKSYDDYNYKIYKYVDVLNIQILITPLDRTADLRDKYKKAEPLANYLDTKKVENAKKFASFMNMLENLKIAEIENLEKEQEKLNEKIPMEVKYNNNYIWQIYLSSNDNKYFMLVSETELDNPGMFYLIKKQLESKKSKKKIYIFTPITHMDYSGKLYSKLQIADIENYLWYFTKEWPTIFEIFDKDNKQSIRIVGKTKVYEKISSDYIINLEDEEKGIELYKLLKALFILSTGFPNDYKFSIAISTNGEIELKHNDTIIEYKTLHNFITEQVKIKIEELKNIVREKKKQELNLEKLKDKVEKQNAEYLEKQKQISTFLECKKTFFGKVKYFFNGKKKKDVTVIKRNLKTKDDDENVKINDTKDITYEFVERKVYTIEDIIEIVTKVEKHRKEYKNVELDVKALELKSENLTRKIKNAKIYIAEINSHKKSIFEFWKFANKDELPSLNEADLEETLKEKIEKEFDYEEDIADFGKKADSVQRVKLSKNEADALFAFRYCTNTMKILNNTKSKELSEKELKEIEEEFLRLKQEYEKYSKDIDAIEFDVFGNLLNDKTIQKIEHNAEHRESRKDKYRVLNINSDAILEDYIDNVRNYLNLIKEILNKIKMSNEISIYKSFSTETNMSNIDIFNINPEKEIQKQIENGEKEIYLYKIHIDKDTPVAFYSNYIFYDNYNKTLPEGMDLSTEVLINIDKLKLKEKVKTKFNINVIEDEYNIKVVTVNVIEYNT